MKSNRTSQLWATHCAGRELTPEEECELREAVANDDVLLSDLIEDRKMHRTLAVLGEIDATRDQFIDGVIAKTPHAPIARRSSQSGERGVMISVLTDQRFIAGIVCATLLVVVPLVALIAARQPTSNDVVERIVRLQVENERLREQMRDIRGAAARNQDDVAAGQAAETVVQAKLDGPVAADPDGDLPLPQNTVRVPRWQITDTAGVTWAVEPDLSHESSEQFDLTRGDVEISTRDGSRIRIEGPAHGQLNAGRHITLEHGRLAALIAADDVGFRVTTPNARVVDNGTEFEVQVDAAGETDVKLHRGEVVVIPWQNGQSGDRIRLNEGSLQRATLSPAMAGQFDLLTTEVSGADEFEGQVSLGGRRIPFTQRSQFEDVRRRLSAQLAESHEDALRNWLKLSETFESVEGTVTVRGITESLDSLEDVMKFEQSLVDDGNLPAGAPPQRTEVFSGTVIINGVRRTFTNREEYEQFREDMLSPLGQLGISGPQRRQQEIDQRTDPFLPKD